MGMLYKRLAAPHMTKLGLQYHYVYLNMLYCGTLLFRQLNNDQTTLFLYLLLQGNSDFASFVFSRSDIDQLVN